MIGEAREVQMSAEAPQRRPTPAQITARQTNWLYACIAGAAGSLACNRVLARLSAEDAEDLDLALQALWRIDRRRVARRKTTLKPLEHTCEATK
jgi:hypothetical protein